MGGDRAGRDEGPPRREDGGGGEDAAGVDASRSGRRRPWAVPVALALAIGVGAGWVAHDVANPAAARPTAPPVAASPTPVPGEPCPAAADAGAAVRVQLDRAVGALRDFDPRTLQGVLDELQRQQARLEAAVASCRAVVEPR